MMNEIKQLINGVTYPVWHSWEECDSQLPSWNRHRYFRLSVRALYTAIVATVTYFLLFATLVGVVHIFNIL